ncbi:DUF4350 domain-containing protein [Qipengyuania sp. MTN3-11]|uniref:DUF4350 domain-containing protein n=1 Tax=Qipengyuania sp. MTN3-11 TaxID=3056557 RepID=UPI0036F41B35
MSTLPIYWPESEAFGDFLREQSEPGWVRRTIEADHRLQPIDTLAAETLSGVDLLLLAQPRALSPAENVALDDWVRGGGRVLLFADPMLTRHSHFPIGDRRRPQDVVLLSPILGRWGLELTFDAGQPEGERDIATPDGALPVNLTGRFQPREGGEAACATEADGVIASCRIGRGRAVLVADAALLDGEDGAVDEQRRERLTALLALASR